MKWETMYSEKKRNKGIKIGEPQVIKKGKKINVRKMINENNIDLEIYPTLEKYGTIKQKIMPDQEVLAKYNEIQNMDRMTLLNEKIKAENIWESIPITIRQEFGNDIGRFVKEGNQWATNKMGKREESKEPNKEQIDKQEETK